jgi:hypothetical protein
MLTKMKTEADAETLKKKTVKKFTPNKLEAENFCT